MNKCILVTRPNHDRTTKYASAWAEEVIEFAQHRGEKVLDLKDKRANKHELEGMIRKHAPSLLFLNGHGDDKCITGQDNEPLVTAGDNEHILKTGIVYNVSCRAGKVLGPGSIDSGAKAFIGYDDDFIFLFDETKKTHPRADKIAELFFRPSNQAMISLLRNHTTNESHQSSKRSFMRSIAKLLTSESSKEETTAIPWLFWNANHQVCLGDNNVTI